MNIAAIKMDETLWRFSFYIRIYYILYIKELKIIWPVLINE